jgi:hypothetical protein
MANTKFGVDQYYQPTPKNIVKLANAIVTGCTFAGSASTLNNQPIIGTIIFVFGYLAKIVSEYFGETPTT